MWEKETEGTRHLSWIWKTPGVSENNSVGLHDALRIEWCKARARRIAEGRTKADFCLLDWQADWWWSQRQCRDLESLDDPGLGEGLKAYAERQASLRRALSGHFQNSV